MTIFTVVILIIVTLGTIGYAEEEFWSSCLKLAVVVMFIIIGIVCICGGGPAGGDYDSYVGGKNWQDPGALANGFKGICAVFVTAAFSFAGTELVGLAATETPNPRKALPGAVKQTFWRITIIYITSLTIIGLAIPHDDPRLFDGEGADVSPFVILMEKAKIGGLNHLINITICISVLSIGLSCVYAGSRTLTALAETGYAPKMFMYVDWREEGCAICLSLGRIQLFSVSMDNAMQVCATGLSRHTREKRVRQCVKNSRSVGREAFS